jgi:pyrroloquinoline quinone (PQQ) biosynthesis protein C
METRTASDLASFRARVEQLVHQHPVVVDNTYTRWFAQGEASVAEVRHLAVQFSVFSHLFVEAQLRKVINAADIDSYRAGKEILMNELGVVFRSGAATTADDADVDPDIVGTEGTVDGGRFRFAAAHFEWLLRFGAALGLSFDDMGKRRHGTTATLFFCDELLRIYGSEDPSVAEGASYAVENWAAAGFWKELIAGLRAFKARECPDLPLGFWIWHDKIEDQHAAHTADELAEAFYRPDFDEERFCSGAIEMLDGVKAFWDGLDRDRMKMRRVA